MQRSVRILSVGLILALTGLSEEQPASAAIRNRDTIVTGRHAPRVVEALELVSRLLQDQSADRCVAYFEARDWHIRESFAREHPLVVVSDTRFPQNADDLFAVAEQQSPWAAIQLNGAKLDDRAWPRLDTCTLGSLLLHEMGHLARRDTSDHEPKDFFRLCKVSCLNPRLWH